MARPCKCTDSFPRYIPDIDILDFFAVPSETFLVELAPAAVCTTLQCVQPCSMQVDLRCHVDDKGTQTAANAFVVDAVA